MYVLNNEILRAAVKRRAEARPGWLPRLVAESLLRVWAAAAGLFDRGPSVRPYDMGSEKINLKKLAPLLALALLWGASPAPGWAQEQEAAAEQAAESVEAAETVEASDGRGFVPFPPDEVEEPPAFTLADRKGDSPELALLKAALRLLTHAQVTTQAIKTCAPAPEAGKALNHFMKHNGNTLAQVMNVIKESGGITPEIKTILDMEVAAGTEALLAEFDCPALAVLVTKNTRDIYRAAELAEDYKQISKQVKRKR
jgi:hypothetical protein